MKRNTIIVILTVLAIAAITIYNVGGSSEKAKVSAVFERYRNALVRLDGKTAVTCVSSGTIQAYQEYCDLAFKGDKSSINSLSMINRMQVLIIRHRIKPELLETMDGRKVFAYSVDKGWTSKGTGNLGITGVSVLSARATARMTKNGKETNEIFYFVRENGKWLVDLSTAFMRMDQAFQALARKQDMEENDFIFSIITSVSGQKVTENIWIPPASKPKQEKSTAK